MVRDFCKILFQASICLKQSIVSKDHLPSSLLSTALGGVCSRVVR